MASPYLYYDGARISRESDLGKELEKWERKPTWTPEGNPFPKMLYRARHRPDGRRSVGEVLDSVCGGYPGAAEQFTRGCQMTVGNETEMVRALQSGWHPTQGAALEGLEASDNATSDATAERHAADQRLSPAAQAEAEAVDHSTMRHVPEITNEAVGEHRRGPGRPRKVVPPVET